MFAINYYVTAHRKKNIKTLLTYFILTAVIQNFVRIFLTSKIKLLVKYLLEMVIIH